MFGLGAQELLLILLIILLLFGAKKIPEIARGLGKAVSEFKKGARELESHMQHEDDRLQVAESKKRAKELEDEIKREETEKRQPPEKKDLAG